MGHLCSLQFPTEKINKELVRHLNHSRFELEIKMAKKPPSAYTKRVIKKQRTFRDWAVIAIYIILALALVVPLVASLFGSTGGYGF